MIVFFLGSHPEMSLAELRLVSNSREAERTNTVAFIDSLTDMGTQWFRQLGGSPKWGEVIATIEKSEKDIESKALEILKNSLKNEAKKEYVLSLYGVRLQKRSFHHTLKEMLPGVKYDGKFEELQHPPAAVEHVMKRGGHEFSLISTPTAVYCVKTLGVQDTRFWSTIDADRPARDMKIGMLPSKLARMMINVSGVVAHENGKVWDPFVGQGTIAMQAATVNVPILGTDKAPASLANAKRNMVWLVNSGLVKQAKHEFYPETIERAKLDRSITAIITEPFLGTPRYKPFTSEFLAKREWREIQRLYGSLLQVASSLLRKGQRLVFIKPVYAFLANNGGQWYNPPLSMSAEAWQVPELLKDLGSLLWIQRDSVVGREIVILEKR